ncbi:hypothetical protein [Nocardiopsis sp. B62]|uniref:hypothetical protein n=1 Tax=Nocardiopsis sp. B62 TaxID=2824874 RepID=UPI001B35B1C7|nr:hypothetical protein [Nocardiopsis sp. B62]MBQ1080722.1 hypothetical protein [Nocardiopsis sp. B62]
MYPVRLPPYMDWAEAQAPRVMADRQRRAAATRSGLAVLHRIANPSEQAEQELADAQMAQLAVGVRQLLARLP